MPPQQPLQALVRALPDVVRHAVVDEGVEALGDDALAVDGGADIADSSDLLRAPRCQTWLWNI